MGENVAVILILMTLYGKELHITYPPPLVLRPLLYLLFVTHAGVLYSTKISRLKAWFSRTFRSGQRHTSDRMTEPHSSRQFLPEMTGTPHSNEPVTSETVLETTTVPQSNKQAVPVLTPSSPNGHWLATFANSYSLELTFF